MQPASAIVRGCSRTSAAQTGTRFRFPRRIQLRPASFYERRFPLFCRTSLPPGRERRGCCGYFNQGRGLSPLPQGKTTTPNYSLKHARSGSDKCSASTSPLESRPRHPRAAAILTRAHFHKVSRAAGPQQTSMQDTEEANFCAKMFGIAGNFEQCFCTGSEQEIVDDLLVLQNQRSQMTRKREDNM